VESEARQLQIEVILRKACILLDQQLPNDSLVEINRLLSLPFNMQSVDKYKLGYLVKATA
jgi:hypothetical protein